jgi:replication-associated recombination protein RarA
MMDQLILHDTTKLQLDQFIASPSHAVLLTGPDGLGKTAVAEAMATAILGLQADKLSSHPHYLSISPDGTSISIEVIRQLQKFLQLKTIGDQPFRRVIIIEYAHALTTEAQNAYLKLLEEPPADTLMILTANTPRALLPTIMSRVQQIAIHVPTEEQLRPLLVQSHKDAAAQRQAYFLSGGLPGLLSALLSDDETHPLLESVTEAKALLQKQPFERLATVDGLSKQRETALNVVKALERIAGAGMGAASAQQDQRKIRQWHTIRKAAHSARQALERSANTKLVLSNLMLHL